MRKVSGRLFGDSSARRSTRSSSTAALAAQQHATNGAAVEQSGDTGGPHAHHITLRSTSTDSTTMGGVVNEVGYRATAALLHNLVQGYRQLCSFQCVEAIATLRKLPVAQYDTAWVFVQLGRAYCEAVDYHKAEAAFAHARARDPYSLEVCGGVCGVWCVGCGWGRGWCVLGRRWRIEEDWRVISRNACFLSCTHIQCLYSVTHPHTPCTNTHTMHPHTPCTQGMEVYSTVLWHMRKEVELSHLAQDAMELDRLAPQTW